MQRSTHNPVPLALSWPLAFLCLVFAGVAANGHSTTNTFDEFGRQRGTALEMGQTSSNAYYTTGIHAGQL